MPDTPLFETTIKVRDYETDSQGIVNNANYLHYLELARHEMCEARGTSFRAMHEAGLDPVVRKIEIEYHHSLTMGDTVRATVSVVRQGARFNFVQHLYNLATGQLSASATVTVVVLKDGRLSRGDEVATLLGL